MVKKIKSIKGITLISLIVTIVVLVILAGVSINMIFQENGIIFKTKEAKKEQFKVRAKESIELALVQIRIEKGKILEEYLIDENSGLHAKDNNIKLDETDAWKGIYSDGEMQVSFLIDKSDYKVRVDLEEIESDL